MRQFYRHFKGGLYELVGLFPPNAVRAMGARHCEKNEVVAFDEEGWRVVYRHLAPHLQRLWHRDPMEFFGTIIPPEAGGEEGDALPIRRFQLIAEQEAREIMAKLAPAKEK